MREAAFKYTFPISKAEERADGYYITGLASGPEIDLEGERVTVEAIASFSRQIEMMAEMGEPIPYRDAHAKDGVLRDLGVVTKAWITPDFHLGVEVRLDVEDNPAALSLFKQIKKGKQFGMSVAGHVIDWADEFVSEVGRIVRTYKDVVLEEISNTTRPAWYPSFGTVLSKAIKDAEDEQSDAAVGESVNDELQTEQETTEAPAVDENTEEQPVEAAAEETAAEETPEVEAEAEAEVEATEEATVEESTETVAAEAEETEEVSEPDDLSTGFREMLVGFHNNLTQMLTAQGLITPVMVTKSVSQDENEPTLDISKAVSDATAPLRDEIEELKKSLTQATARIEELENSPAGDDSPELVEKHATTDEIAKALSEMDPRERLRLGLRLGLSSGR